MVKAPRSERAAAAEKRQGTEGTGEGRRSPEDRGVFLREKAADDSLTVGSRAGSGEISLCVRVSLRRLWRTQVMCVLLCGQVHTIGIVRSRWVMRLGGHMQLLSLQLCQTCARKCALGLSLDCFGLFWLPGWVYITRCFSVIFFSSSMHFFFFFF